MNQNTIVRYIVIAGLFLVPFIPFVVINSFFFPFITGKNFAFRILVELMFGGWVILALTNKRYWPKRSSITWMVATLVVVMALADAFGLNPFKSFWSNLERMEGLIGLLHMGVYFLIASTVLTTEKLWNYFWNTNIAASVVITIYGILQLLHVFAQHQGNRVDATFGNAAYMAIYLVFNIFLTAYLVVSKQKSLFTFDHTRKLQKVVVGGIIILVETYVLYKTETRGAILGLIGGVLVASVLTALSSHRKSLARKVSLGILGITVLAIAGFFAIKNTQFVANSSLSRFSSISLSDATTQSRFVLWNIAWEGFKERPVLGWGQENFNYVFNTHYSPKLFGQEQWFDRTHNVIFDWLITGGALGLLAYLGLYGSLIWFIWKRKNAFSPLEKNILTGLLVAYFIHNLFVFDNLISHVFFFSLAAYITFKTSDQIEHAPHTHHNRLIVPVAALGVIAIIYFAHVPALRANKAIIDALTPQAALQSQQGVMFNGDVTKNLESFKKAIAQNSLGTQEAREQLSAVAGQIDVSPVPIKSSSDLISVAIAEGKNQVAATPKDARAYVILGSLYYGIGQYENAIIYLEQAQKLSPQKQTILFELGASYIGIKQPDKALEYFKQAYELAPQFEDSRITYAAAAIYAKKDALAIDLLKDIPSETLIKSDKILQAYVSSGQKTKVIDIWKSRVVLDPTNAQNYISLAVSYLYNNDTKNAIVALEKAIEIQPLFKEQGEAIIKDIKDGKDVLNQNQ